MADFNESLKAASLAILNRELSEEERTEFLELGAALGMNTVEDYLYILMIFKRHSDIMERRFDEIGALKRKINDTIEHSVERILGEGAARIGADMGETIAIRSREVMSSVKEYYGIRGSIVAVSVTGILATLAYWFGLSGVYGMFEADTLFRGVLFLPAGWWMFLSFVSYTYFWCFDNWNRVKESTLYKCLLGLLGAITAILLLFML